MIIANIFSSCNVQLQCPAPVIHLMLIIYYYYSCCAGNSSVTFYEMDSIYGHDTFLLDTTMGTAIKVIIDESLGCCLNGCCFVSGSLRATLKKE